MRSPECPAGREAQASRGTQVPALSVTLRLRRLHCRGDAAGAVSVYASVCVWCVDVPRFRKYIYILYISMRQSLSLLQACVDQVSASRPVDPGLQPELRILSIYII